MSNTTQAEKSGFRVKLQRFGSSLSGMIMPNIGAFIAWGIITALFIPDGWFPNEDLALLVGPMINYLLPILIGFTGGKMIYGGDRGGIVGAVATMGVIAGSDIPMFLGAMIVGPIAGWAIKKVDGFLQPRIPQGFEMLINNFSAGILAALLAIGALLGVGPLVEGLTDILSAGVEAIINAGLLPLVNILIEPAKILFLNNAINHGILSPLGAEQAAEAGKSILFLIETNPGPGLGILLAFMFFGKGSAKQTSPGAAIIHFFGGIHEIYFPYILMKPTLILAAIAGGVSGMFTFSLLNVGLVAPPSPGSIFALIAMTPKGGNHLGVILGVLVATAVSFAIASLILKTSKKNEEEDISEAAAKMQEMKGKKSSVAGNFESKAPVAEGFNPENVNKIIFACDAGMGSSAMGASILKNKAKKAGLDIDITNTAINNLPADADVVITHKDLTPRAKDKLPTAHHISVENFLNSPKYDELIEKLK
ncbi:PTS mannitol transporter subunit IICB [Bacillus mesophilum]|uniref:PTS system mannitol-specific EIICB component n=1 Tax=Bacillus mesophilum TaxID=1071718 RepID=A0A7V7RM83_9BACI|nr:PTS mannitol transporter subunit IICB [Bacillus mesophilum]KAB2333000.1 PTS mannitol transporter subunit IICB [Bacillus mesophilum]